MAKSASACSARLRDPHDQETEIRQVSVVFPQERSENGQTKKSRHVQEQDSGEETRTRGSVFQTALGGLVQRNCAGGFP